MDRRLVESPRFPVDVVNVASAREKGPGRPPYWEMVFWWTRKPLAVSRAVILASILPENYPVDKFIRIVYPSYTGKRSRLFDKTPHYLNPDWSKLEPEYVEKLKNTSLLDPFAGFGSIPLEALRLGVGSVVAVELLPTAVVFLRAILEYPVKYGGELVRDVEKWGGWIIDELKKDSDIRELYDEDVAVYIGTWEIKCPYCGKYTPVIGNWWLARVRDEKGFKAYMRSYNELPENVKRDMELKSTEYVLNLFTSEYGCEVLEIHLFVENPYDLLFRCREGSRTIEYMVEVKSHLEKINRALLTGNQTETAEKNPDKYIVCIVSNLREDIKDWSIYCEKYSRIPKKIIMTKRALVGL